MNPCLPELSARAENHVVDWAKHTTQDGQVVSLRSLLIDVDSKRVSGISATDEQHEATLARGSQLRLWLMGERNWPAPLVMDSGSGCHLIVRIALGNDEAARRLLERVLKALAQRFDDETVEIDTGTFNPSQLGRIPGTLNRKGDNSAERPHRKRCSPR